MGCQKLFWSDLHMSRAFPHLFCSIIHPFWLLVLFVVSLLCSFADTLLQIPPAGLFTFISCDC